MDQKLLYESLSDRDLRTFNSEICGAFTDAFVPRSRLHKLLVSNIMWTFERGAEQGFVDGDITISYSSGKDNYPTLYAVACIPMIIKALRIRGWRVSPQLRVSIDIASSRLRLVFRADIPSSRLIP